MEKNHGEYFSYYEDGKLSEHRIYMLFFEKLIFFARISTKMEHCAKPHIKRVFINGKRNIYFENGELAAELNFFEGKKLGEQKRYFKGGALKAQEYFYEPGSKDGEQLYYFIDGKLEVKDIYEKVHRVYQEKYFNRKIKKKNKLVFCKCKTHERMKQSIKDALFSPLLRYTTKYYRTGDLQNLRYC